MSEELVPRQSEPIEVNRENAIEVANHVKQIQSDMKFALALIKKYQRNLSMMGAPDPDVVEARKFMQKYGEAYQGWSTFQIFLDGLDISEHPDSVAGTAEEFTELIEGEVVDDNDD